MFLVSWAVSSDAVSSEALAWYHVHVQMQSMSIGTSDAQHPVHVGSVTDMYSMHDVWHSAYVLSPTGALWRV